MATERLAASVRSAQAAMHGLRMALHYLHCDGVKRCATKACPGWTLKFKYALIGIVG